MIPYLKNNLRKKWILLKDKKNRFLAWIILFAFVFLFIFYHVPNNYTNFGSHEIISKNYSAYELIRYNRLKIWHRLNPALINYTSETIVLSTLPKVSTNIVNSKLPPNNAVKFLSFVVKSKSFERYIKKICHIKGRLYSTLNYAQYIFNSLIHSNIFTRPYTNSVVICYLASQFPVITLQHFDYLIDASMCTCNNSDLTFKPANKRQMCYRSSKDSKATSKKDILFTNISTTRNNSISFDHSIKNKAKLILLIHSAPGNYENRMAIRETWASIKYLKIKSIKNPLYVKTYENDYHRNLINILLKNYSWNIYSMTGLEIQLVFLLASLKNSNADHFQRPSSPSPLNLNGMQYNQSQTNFDYSIYDTKTESEELSQDKLAAEAQAYGDIVQGNFVDSYKNLTFKMIMGFKWVTSQLNYADYVLKLDDDIFVDIFQVYSIIDTLYNMRNFYLTNRNAKTNVSYSKLEKMLDKTKEKSGTKIPFIIPQNDVSWVVEIMQQYERGESGTNNKNGINKFAQQDLICDMLDSYMGIGNGPRSSPNNDGWIDDIILCNVWIGMPILRDRSSKWYVSEEEFKGKFFPPYCSGWAILLSSQAAYKLMLNAPALPYFWIDDVHVTGSLAAYSNLSLTNINSKFTFEEKHLTNWLKTASKTEIDQFPPFTFGPTWGDSTLMLALWNKTYKAYQQYFTIIK